jgi:hypothetical protein
VWKEATGPDRYRRALYTFRFRSVPHPPLQAFDTPNGDASCVRRPRSNTPLQALTTLNEPLFVECAQALGSLALREGGTTDEARIDAVFRRCTGRRPDAGERKVLLEFLALQKERLSRAGDRLKELVGPQEQPTAERAAWTALARVLLNLDETITKE